MTGQSTVEVDRQERANMGYEYFYTSINTWPVGRRSAGETMEVLAHGCSGNSSG